MRNIFLIVFITLVPIHISYECNLQPDIDTECSAPEKFKGEKLTGISYLMKPAKGKKVSCSILGMDTDQKHPWNPHCFLQYRDLGVIDDIAMFAIGWNNVDTFPTMKCRAIGQPSVITWSYRVGSDSYVCPMDASQKAGSKARKSLKTNRQIKLLTK